MPIGVFEVQAFGKTWQIPLALEQSYRVKLRHDAKPEEEPSEPGKTVMPNFSGRAKSETDASGDSSPQTPA